MNKIAKTALMTGTALCVAGVVLSTAGYFAGGKDFTYASDHVYVSGGNSSAHKNLAVMKKEQIDDFTKLNVDFEDLDLDIRTSDDDHYYMEYKLEKNGKKDPLTKPLMQTPHGHISAHGAVSFAYQALRNIPRKVCGKRSITATMP